MAVTIADLTTASGILKNNYEGQVVSQINNPNSLFAEIEKSSKDVVEGSKVVFNARMGVSQAIGNRGDGGTLPGPQRTRNVQPYFNLAYMYGTMRITGPLMEASRTDAGAFIRAVRNEVEGLTEGLSLDTKRQTYGSAAGDGRLAVCGTTSGSLTVQLDADANMLYFEEGMVVDIIVISSGAKITDGDSRVIESIDEDNKTITLEAGNTVTTSSLHIVCREDNYTKEMAGLEQIIGTGTLQGIDPTVAGNRRWKSNVNSAFGAFSLLKLQAEIDKAHNKSGEWIDRLYSQEGPRNLYLATLIADRRIVSQGDDKKLNGGFTGLSYTGGGTEAVWVKDPFVPDSKTVYGIVLKRLELRRAKDFEFIEINGLKWIPELQGSSGTDTYKAVMAAYHQLMTPKRNSHLKLQGVTA